MNVGFSKGVSQPNLYSMHIVRELVCWFKTVSCAISA